MIELYLIPIIISFLISLISTKKFISFFKSIGVIALDLHKKNKPKLASAGGIPVGLSTIFGLLTFIGLKTFIYGNYEDTIPILASISSMLLIIFVGFLDDLNVKRKKVKTKEGKDIRVGLPQWLKPILTFPAAIPLMVIKAGYSVLNIPFIGPVDFGIWYPLVLIPIGVVGASNAVNLLGGFNGVEAGMGIVYLATLSLYTLLTKNISSIIFLTALFALIGYIKYNWYPARILPGDSLTYFLGATVATGVIVGNIERLGVLVLTPFILEFFLKARAKFKASCLGKLRKDGTLRPPYGKKIYSLTHIIMNLKRVTEKEVVFWLILMELIVCIVSLIVVFYF